MNKHLQEMRTAIQAYHKTVKDLAVRYENAKQIYVPEALEKEKELIDQKRNQARATATEAIRKARDEAIQGVKDWGTVHGGKLTDDVKLLEVGVTPEQFDSLVDRYKDNYSMLQALSNYGNRQNRQIEKENAGKGFMPETRYSVERIPDLDSMTTRWEKLGESAVSTLRNLDSSDPFTRSLTESGVERWGENVDI